MKDEPLLILKHQLKLALYYSKHKKKVDCLK